MAPPQTTPKEAPPAVPPNPVHVERVEAIERGLGMPIDKDRALHAMERTSVLPFSYGYQAFKYAREGVPKTPWIKAVGKGIWTSISTGGLRVQSRDAIFINPWMHPISNTKVRLHETLHAASEGKDLPQGRDFLGGRRAVSGIEKVAADGTIQLTNFNEALTNFFTVRAAQELKGDPTPPKYKVEVKIVSRIASLLDAQGQDGAKFLAKAYLEHDADSIRQAVDTLSTDGAFEALTNAMKKESGFRSLLRGLPDTNRIMTAIERQARETRKK